MVLFPVLFILVCYEHQNKMWKIRNLVYCLQGWNNCMPWVRSLVEVRQVQQEPLPNRNWALSLVSVREPFQPTTANVKTWFSFSLYGVGWAETLKSWSPAFSYSMWPLIDVFRELVHSTLNRFTFLSHVTLSKRVTLLELLSELSIQLCGCFLPVFSFISINPLVQGRCCPPRPCRQSSFALPGQRILNLGP